MIFGRLALADAAGAVLAHSTRLPGGTLAKGSILTGAMLRAMAAAGLAHVIAARLEPGDVGEDEAAARLAAAIAGPGMLANRATHGRANLIAAHAGLFRADATALGALNRLHEGLTIATLADATPVQPGTLLVTVKVIPFAVAGDILKRAEAQAAAPMLRVSPFQPMRVGLVLTDLPGMKDSVFASTIEATRQRVHALGGTLMTPRRVAHEAGAIAAALRVLLAEAPGMLLVAGASATVDRLDEAPAALVLAGGAVTHFGMPVDPGNLICLGHVTGVPALILPGCARSPSLNGIDLVLRRLFAGETVGSADIADMGVGGLLKDFPARPAPRTPPNAAQPPRIAGLILAAGLSSRMAPDNKLLLPDAAGTPMVARVAQAVCASRANPVLAVVGHDANAVSAALAAHAISFVYAPNYADGLSASLRAGLDALPETVDAVLVCLGDMPLVSTADINLVLAAYNRSEGRLVVVPTHRGKRGNPVLWDSRFFAAMQSLTGDTGARALLRRHAEAVVEVELGGDGILTDFDTPAALAQSERSI